MKVYGFVPGLGNKTLPMACFILLCRSHIYTRKFNSEVTSKMSKVVLSIKVNTYTHTQNPNCLPAFMVLISETFLTVNRVTTHVSEVSGGS